MSRGFGELRSIAEFVNGAAFKPEDWGDSGARIIRIQNLTDSRKPYNRTTRVVPDGVHVRPGDLLVSWSASLGVFQWNEPDVALLNQHIFRVIPDDSKVDKRYLRYGLELALRDMQRHLHGATMQHVNRDEFLSTKIYLPPLPEQRRIAAILDKADELRAKRRAAIEQLGSVTRSVFLEMFGNPSTNPKGFPIGNVERLVRNPKRDIRCGPFGTQLKVHEITDSGIPIFGIENVLDDGFNASTSKCLTPVKAEQLKAFDVAAGDVLVTRMGTIGRACVVPPTVTNGRFSYHLFRIRPDESLCDPKFLAATIAHSGVFQSQLRLLAHGAVMDGLSTENLRAVRFPLPPLPLQREFAQQIARVQSVKLTMVSAQSTGDEAFFSLQHRAFAGTL